MKITKTMEGDKLLVALEGRLDTTTAPELTEALGTYEGINSMELDFAELEYISSAGLRVVLAAQKTMKTRNGLVVRNVSRAIMEVFEITGFTDILTIE